MANTKFDKITKVLKAVERAETAQLKSTLNAISQARQVASELRMRSAALPALKTAEDMQVQSARQHVDEAKARALEQQAEQDTHKAQAIRQQLAITLGRIQAVETVCEAARKAENRKKERREIDDAVVRRQD